MREAFEHAILDDPDDLASYAAFADWLAEQGDPRGEFIRLQLALEDESRSRAEREELRAREQELLRQYERDWLGQLAPHLLEQEEEWQEIVGPTDTRRYEYRWRRGFLTVLRAQCLTTSFAQALATSPAARFLRELRIFAESRYWDAEDPDPPPPRIATPEGIEEHWELLELIGAPCLGNLRVFQMGDPDGEPPEGSWGDCHTEAHGLEHVIAGMPRIEELHLLCKAYDVEGLFALPSLRHLRVLRLYHLGDLGSRGERDRYEYPLDVLSANEALGNLTHLLFHPHQEEYQGAIAAEGPRPCFLPLEQVEALVRSPHLGKLTHLQLRLSNMGDAGVRVLLDSGILRRLRWLDLRHGCISDAGARLLAACPDLAHLEHLDLSRNAVTAQGLALLQARGVRVWADNPLTAAELRQEAYLFEGDGE